MQGKGDGGRGKGEEELGVASAVQARVYCSSRLIPQSSRDTSFICFTATVLICS